MQLDAIAQRYADALFHWAKEERATAAVQAELITLQEAFEGVSAQFYGMMANPSVLPKDKQALLADISKNASVAVKNLLALLVEHNRMQAFPEVVTQYQQLVDASENRVRGTLVTASAVQSDTLESVAQQVKNQFGYAEVVLTNAIQPELLGGAQLQLGDRRIDGSYLSQLNQLAAATSF